MYVTRRQIAVCIAVLLSASIVNGRKHRAYDYILVGGGTAGCVLAARLSEDSHRSVLLLEAGEEEEGVENIQQPGKWPSLLCSPFHWMRLTTSQKWCCSSYVNRRVPLHGGKVLGGGSSVNAMVHTRGSRHDYDEWARRGCDGWSYKDVLPYFIKSETFKGKGDAGYHGKDGPLVVTDLRRTPLSDAFVNAGAEIGYKYVDMNGKELLGVGYAQSNTYDGLRYSTAKGYLRPARCRTNLCVITKAHVTKLLFRGKRVVGVEYVRHNKKQRARATKEVILTAGAIGSSHILLLSGVGPKKHLKKKHVPVVVDLPVGNNVHDHIKIAIDYTTTADISVPDDEERRSMLTDAEYKSFGKIPRSGVTEGLACFRSKHQPSHVPYPYFMLFFKGKSSKSKKSKPARTDEQTLDTTCRTNNLHSDVFTALHNHTGQIKVTIINLHPRYTGTIRLNTTDPFEQPLINAKYLRHKKDVKVLVDGIRMTQRLVSTMSFKALGASIVVRLHPGCKRYHFDSNAYWRCYTKRTISSLNHRVGSCKMGSWCDPTAVVDPQLRVRGVKGLRVADASVMPFEVSAGTNAAVVMIAEKAADMIRTEHECYGRK